MLDDIARISSEFDAPSPPRTTAAALDELRVRYFGRKGGLIPALFSRLKEVPKEQKKDAGDALNKLRDRLESELKEKHERVAAEESKRKESRDIIDVTLPARLPASAISIPSRSSAARWRRSSARWATRSIPAPRSRPTGTTSRRSTSRPTIPRATRRTRSSSTSTSYLLRTHTSNVQIRTMERHKPPVKVLSCGRVYRRDEITMRRSPMFHQAEGFLVDRGIHIGHLRATLEHFIKRLFGADSKMRMRPSYFPFTEPSAEVDMSCVFCKGAGCGTCSQTGWMEILGCGMIHPQVLRNVGIDPEEWSGFAFGLGLDRVAMLKFDIPNIRTLFENDLRVLQQF